MNTAKFWWPLGVSVLASAIAFGCVGNDPALGVDSSDPIEVVIEGPESIGFGSSDWNTAIGAGGAKGKFGTRSGGLGRLRVIRDVSTSGESYSSVKENAFKLVSTSPRSTFGADVDTASYSNIRRYLNYGQLPPKAAVRVEEMINYFEFDYPKPKGRDSFSVTLEQGACPWNTEHQLVLVGLRGREIPPDQVPPRNLVFLIDVSGSMRSADKLPLVVRSLKLMLRKLTNKDTVAIVTYAGKDRVALEPTSCANIAAIENCLDNLATSGGTNGAGGIQKSYELAQAHFAREHVNRVILVTDGDFNVGIRDQKALQKLIEEKRETGVYLTVIGVGTGNLGDARMSMLAKHGNGQYIYVDGDKEARRQLDDRLQGTLVTIAKDVKLQIEFNPGKVAGYRLIGYERRVMKDKEFRDDKKDSGEVGAGHAVTALYELVPAGSAVPGMVSTVAAAGASAGFVKSDHLMDVRLRYKAPWAERAKESSHRLKAQAAKPSSDNLAFAGVVAAFGMVLSKSAHLGTASLEMVRDLAKPLAAKVGARVEFHQLVAKAIEIRSAAMIKVVERKPSDPETQVGLAGQGYLARQQLDNGSFQVLGDCPVSDIGLTALAVMAFHCGGTKGRSSIRSGPHREEIRNAIRWLRKHQTKQGQFFLEGSINPALDQVLASFAMCQTQMIGAYRILKANAVRGRDYMVKNLQPGTDLRGWYLLVNQCFKAAKIPGLDAALRAQRWQPTGGSQLEFPINYLDARLLPVSTAGARAGAGDEVIHLLPTANKVLANGGPGAATCYFTTLAMQSVSDKQGKEWREVLQRHLAAKQNDQGKFVNSQKNADPRYDTALLVMTLLERRSYQVQ
jgi:Ca-activated chloride channel family protein